MLQSGFLHPAHAVLVVLKVWAVDDLIVPDTFPRSGLVDAVGLDEQVMPRLRGMEANSLARTALKSSSHGWTARDSRGERWR